MEQIQYLQRTCAELDGDRAAFIEENDRLRLERNAAMGTSVVDEGNRQRLSSQVASTHSTTGPETRDVRGILPPSNDQSSRTVSASVVSARIHQLDDRRRRLSAVGGYNGNSSSGVYHGNNNQNSDDSGSGANRGYRRTFDTSNYMMHQ